MSQKLNTKMSLSQTSKTEILNTSLVSELVHLKGEKHIFFHDHTQTFLVKIFFQIREVKI